MPFKIVRNDIVKMKTDAIVNAANIRLQMGSGVCGAIFNAAGRYRLQEECDKIGKCEVGEAVITDGMENASCEYNYEKIKRMIERQKESYNWEFVFLGANIDAISEAAKFGISKDRASNCKADSEAIMQ